MTATKQRGVPKATLDYRAKMLGGEVGKQVAEYNAEVYRAQRDERVAKKMRKAMKVVHGVHCICTACIMAGA
jgi:hypothetical protein